MRGIRSSRLNKRTGTISHADLVIGGAVFSVTEEARAWNSDAPPSLGATWRTAAGARCRPRHGLVRRRCLAQAGAPSSVATSASFEPLPGESVAGRSTT
jgi:hypothetical protein